MAHWILPILLVVSGCATAFVRLPEPKPGWRLGAGDALFHVESGLVFPVQSNGLNRGSVHIYNETGTNASVQYEQPSPWLVLTVYVYPRQHGEPEPVDEFRAAVQAAVDARTAEVHVVSKEEGALGHPKQALQGYLAGFSWVKGGKRLGGWLLLVPDVDWFYKVRVTTDDFQTEGWLADSFRMALGLLEEALPRTPERVKQPRDLTWYDPRNWGEMHPCQPNKPLHLTRACGARR